jgi:hypothetical protein
MRTGEIRRGWLAAAGSAALVLALMALAGGAVAGGSAPRAGIRADTPPAPEPGPPPRETPAADGTAPAAPETAAAPAAGAPPRIIRIVCTDRICGNCDGKCHRDSGHVAVDKKGHCACTPFEGSDLDRATRDAYARRPPQ